MNCWITHESDIVLINNLGFAFLRRISSDKAILETMGNADLGRQADSVYSIWNLLRESLRFSVSMHCKLRGITPSRHGWQMFVSSLIPPSAPERPSVSRGKIGQSNAEKAERG